MTGGAADGPTRWPAAAAAALVAVALLLVVVGPDLPHRSSDSGWYLSMARGEGGDVPAPFSGRLVHTGLARLLVVAGLDAGWAFVAVAVPAMWLGLTAVAVLLRRAGVPTLVFAAAAGTWFAAALLRDATLPDVWAFALLAVVLLALAEERPVGALTALLLAVVCRESLVLFAIVLAYLAWRAGRRGLAAGVLAAAAAGLLTVGWLGGAGNTHAMGGPAYLAAKFGFNASRNVAGWELWVPTIDYCEPRRVWDLPGWLPTGAVDRIGVCGFNPRRPLWLLVAWGGTFGAVPGWLWARRTAVRAAWPTAPLWQRAALAYGLAAALLAPAAGTMLPRLVGYGWTACWLAAPLLAGWPRRWRVPLGLHLVAAWGVPLLAAARPLDVPVLAAAALLGIGLNAAVAFGAATGPRGP